MEDGDLAVDLRHNGAVRSVFGVHETLDRVLRPEALRDVLNYCMCGRVVLVALWDVEALKERRDKKKTEMLLYLCIAGWSCSRPDIMF